MKKYLFLASILFGFSDITFSQSVTILPQNIENKSSSTGQLLLENVANPVITGLRRNGTLAAPTPTLANLTLLRIDGKGQWGTGGSTDDGASIEMVASSNWNASANPAFIRFSTAETIENIERMRITSTGFLGIGTAIPLSKLDVSGDISISSPNLGFGSRKLQFYSDQGTGNEWRPGYIESADGAGGSSYTGRLDFYTNGTGVGNKLGSVLGMSVLNGKVGVGSSAANSPDFPLHVTSSATTSSSTTGAFGIGLTNSFHLTMDNNQIDSWNNTAGNTLYLNYHSNAKVQIGNGSTGNLDVNGFSNLGDGAPAIKMKKLTGTTSSSSTGSTTIAHGLDGTKILSIDVLVEYSTGDYVPPGYDLGGGSNFKFTYYLGGSNIYIINQNSPNILSKPIKIIVTYEQ